MFQVQDLLDLDEELWDRGSRGRTGSTCPARSTEQNWTWRMPLSVEELSRRTGLRERSGPWPTADGKRPVTERARMSDRRPTVQLPRLAAGAGALRLLAGPVFDERQRGLPRPARGAAVHAADQRGAAEGGRRPGAESLRAGDMNAMGLIDEILHYVAGLYRERIEPEAFTRRPRVRGSTRSARRRSATAIARFRRRSSRPAEAPDRTSEAAGASAAGRNAHALPGQREPGLRPLLRALRRRAPSTAPPTRRS